MELANSSKTKVTSHHSTWLYITEDLDLHKHGCEDHRCEIFAVLGWCTV